MHRESSILDRGGRKQKEEEVLAERERDFLLFKPPFIFSGQFQRKQHKINKDALRSESASHPPLSTARL